MAENLLASTRIRTRPLESEQDWWRCRSLLVETHAIAGPGFNWELRHWDGNRFHNDGPSWQPERYRDFCLWETERGRLIGVAHKEGGDELCFQVHPDFRAQIEPEMLAWGEACACEITPDGKHSLHVNVYEYDAPRKRMLENAGFQKMTYGWITRWMRLHQQSIPEPHIAEGYTLSAFCMEGEEHWKDCARMADLLNAAFERPNFHQAADTHGFSTRSPGYSNELHLVAVAPDGGFAAHAALNYDEGNRYAVFEPVCTHPDHRRKGLAQALMFELLHRIRRIGATHVEVSTGDADAANALYDSIGFTEYYKAYYWKKVW